MKFQKLESFEKHFKEAFPKHLSSVYAVVCSQESERKKIMGSLIHLLEKESDLKRFQQVKPAIMHLNGGSLFSTKVTAVLDGAELLIESDIELLLHYIGTLNPQGYLLLGSATAKHISTLYNKGKKEMVVLDLSAEKPWEEKQRLQKWLVQTVHAQKKQIAPDAVEAIFERLPCDRLLLTQEIEKLICYVGQRTELIRTDVEALCSTSVELNHFQLAQQLVWGGLKNIPDLNDLAVLLPLIGQLRSQFEMGLKMAVLIKKGASGEEIAAAFPRLWPKALQQCLEGARQFGISYFKKGLMHLFDLEFGLKTSKGRAEVLFTIFCANVRKF